MAKKERDSCPFCGWSKLRVVAVKSSYAVTCNNCEASGPVGTTHSMAWDLWNDRCSPSSEFDAYDTKILEVFTSMAGSLERIARK